MTGVVAGVTASGGLPLSSGLPWTPARLSGLLWLRADTGVTQAGSGVSDWLDKAGSGRKMTQTSDAARPQFNPSGIGGQPTVDGDGVNYYMVSAAAFPDVTAEYSILSVQHINAATNFGMTFSFSDVRKTELRQRIDTGKVNIINTYSTDGSEVTAGTSSVGADDNIVATCKVGTDGLKLYRNGVLEGTASPVLVDIRGVAGLLARSDGSFPAEARLAELVYVPRAITEAERSKWNAYVAERYGI